MTVALGELDAFLGVPFADAARIAEVTKRKLWYWDQTNLVRPGIRGAPGPRTTVRLYSFNDLVALFVTARLRQRGFSLQHIRKVARYLQDAGYEAPLAELTFATYGREIYFQHDDGSWEGDASRAQLVIRETLVLDEIRKLIRSRVARPAEAYGKVERTRGRVGRKPLFAGTRIPVATIRRRVVRGATDKQILAAYPDLTAADIAFVRAEIAGA
jgi:DNA-binding transcriptional MerR regulator